MSQSNISGNIAYRPNFLEPIQHALSSGTQAEPRAFLGNFVEPLTELALTDLPTSMPRPLGQREQFSKGNSQRTTHYLPTASQEAMLLQELAASRQLLQQQQALTESLTEQLVSSRECIAQMERDLALLQQSYDEQQHLLKSEEANCQNLRTRLYRQQHQALQFKAALEKCLEDSLLRHQPDSSREDPTVASQPQHPTSHSSLQRVSAPVESLEAADSAPLDCVSLGVDSSGSSAERCQAAAQHIQVTSRGEDVSPETAYPQEIYSEDRPSRPLNFRGQPVQPWSASQSFPNSGSTHQEQPTIHPATSIQTVEVEAPVPNRETASAHSTRSAPLLDPLQPTSKRKLPVKIELPTFPRH